MAVMSATRVLALALVLCGCTALKDGLPVENDEPNAGRVARSEPRNADAGCVSTSGNECEPTDVDSASLTTAGSAASDAGRAQNELPTWGTGDAASQDGGTGPEDAGQQATAVSPTPPSDVKQPGNSKERALNLGLLGDAQEFRDQFVGPGETEDYYRLELPENGTLTYGVSDLSGALQFQLFPDMDLINESEPYAYSNASAADLLAHANLPTGVYFVRVHTTSASGSLYTFKAAFVPYEHEEPSPAPGADVRTALEAGTLTSVQSWGGYVGKRNRADFYRFVLEKNTVVTLAVTDVRDNVTIELFDDAAIIDPSKPLKRAWASDTTEYTGDETLAAGTYFIKLSPYSSTDDALYWLAITAKSSTP